MANLSKVEAVFVDWSCNNSGVTPWLIELYRDNLSNKDIGEALYDKWMSILSIKDRGYMEYDILVAAIADMDWTKVATALEQRYKSRTMWETL